MRDGFSASKFGRGRHALRMLRDATADHICDVRIPGASEDFSFRSSVVALDKALLVDACVSSWSNERTPRHIARGGIDHYQITLCLSGELTFAAGRRSVTMRPGDLCLMDMAQASRTSVAADHNTRLSRVITLVLPHSTLAPMLAAPDAATASLVSRDDPNAKFLAAQYLALYNNGAASGSAPAGVATEDLAGVIADAVGSARSVEGDVERAKRHLLLASIKRYIDANLQTEMVTVEQLCRRFRLSRATLYRLFEPEGGLWSYVQDRRLNRAFRMLASPASRRVRMVDMAVDFNFSSDTTFVRAFRRRFGLTPGEVRRLAQAGRRNGHGGTELLDSLIQLKTLASD